VNISDSFFVSLNSDVSSYVNIRFNNEIDPHSKDSIKNKVISIACYSFLNREASFNFDSVNLDFSVTWEICNAIEDLKIRISGLSKLLNKNLKPLKEKIKEDKVLRELKDDIENRVKERLTREFFLERADQGDKDAQYGYACMCYEGKGGIRDYFSARKYFKFAADQNCRLSQYRYAHMCFEGVAGGCLDVEDGFILARKYYGQSADQGYKMAQFNYALMWFEGKGGLKDTRTAKGYYSLASTPSYHGGSIGTSTKNNKVLEECQVVFDLLNKINRAGKGDHFFLYEYAKMCSKGEGVEKNNVIARACFKLAADQGDKEAQYEYACMCYKGKGGDKDFFVAKEYFKLVADQGDKEAQYNYACMCYEGKGGNKDFFTARKYFKLAADRGDKDAQNHYACMCYEGEGGDKDLFAAKKYFKLSADQGDVEANIKYEKLCK
jgi:uncharacterized protein